MIKKALLPTLFIGYIICPAQAQNTDTVSQKRETFVLEEGRPDRSKSRSNQSKLVVAVNNFSQKSNSDRHSKLLWNDGHWAGIGIHYSGLITNLGDMQLPDDAQYLSQSAKSIGVTLNPIDYTLLKSRHVGLLTGIGVEFNNFRFDNNIALKQENGVTVPDYQYEEQHIRLSKSKLYPRQDPDCLGHGWYCRASAAVLDP